MDVEPTHRMLPPAFMPPPPPPAKAYVKVDDLTLNPLSINNTLAPVTRGSGGNAGSSQTTPARGVAHVRSARASLDPRLACARPARSRRRACAAVSACAIVWPTRSLTRVPSPQVTDIAKEYAAAAAATKTTPRTEENTRVLQSSDPIIQEQLALQREQLRPRGRVQQLFTARPTADEQRTQRTRKRREQRARAKLLEQHHATLLRRLHDCGQYSKEGLTLWELLMVEFALQPSSAGLSSGQMRTRYQEKLYAARLRDHVPRQRGIGLLPDLRQLLLKYGDARAQALARLRHAKYFTADFLSGGYRIKTLIPLPDETLMALMERSNAECLGRRGVGRWANAKPGGGAYALRQAKLKGKYTIAWRAQSHILRMYAAKKPISGGSYNDVAAAGARLFLEGLEEHDLKTESPRTVSYHDQQNHLVQRWGARDELTASDSPIVTSMDIGSKRKNAYQCVAEVGTRLDGTRLREVTKIGKLLPDPEDDFKRKSGRNGAKVLYKGAQEFGSPHRNKHYVVCDAATDNTGTLIHTGKGGSVAHFRESICNATADENGENGHILLTQINCASHIGHNESGVVVASLGECKRDEFIMKRRARSEESGGRPKITAFLDEAAHYINSRPGLRTLIGEREECPREVAQMATESQTRWGEVIKQVVYLAPFTSRPDTVADYAIAKEPKRSEAAAAADEEEGIHPSVRNFKSRAARLFFTELLDPAVRVDLMLLQIYGEVQPKPSDDDRDQPRTQSIVRFIHRTENDGDFVVNSWHRILRLRRAYLEELAGDGSADEPDGVFETFFRPRIEAAIAAAPERAYDGVNVRARASEMHKIASQYFNSHTDFWFENPMLLPFGMLDEGGHAVKTAKELVVLAGEQGPLATFPQLVASFLHEGITAPDVLAAFKYPQSTSLAKVFLDAGWKLVVQLSEMDEDHGYDPSTVLLRDVPALSPLYDILERHARHLPVSSFFLETVVKTVIKVLHHAHRQNDEIATRMASALHRDQKRLYEATEALLSLASREIGTDKARRKKPRPAAPSVPVLGSQLLSSDKTWRSEAEGTEGTEGEEGEEGEEGDGEEGDGEEAEEAEEDLNTLNVPELKARLRARGLPVGGVKHELVTRLMQAYAEEAADEEAADEEGSADEEEEEETEESLGTLTVPQLQSLLRDRGLTVGGKKADLIQRLLEIYSEERAAEQAEEEADDAEMDQVMGEELGDLPFLQRNFRQKRDALLPNLVVSAVHSVDPESDATLVYFAEVRELPPKEGPRSKSVGVHWLDEVAPRDSDVYELESTKCWRGIKWISISTLMDVAPPMRKLPAANGLPDQWVLRRGDKYSASAEAAIEAHKQQSTWADVVLSQPGASKGCMLGSAASAGSVRQGTSAAANGTSDGSTERPRESVNLIDDDSVNNSDTVKTLTPESVELRTVRGMLMTSSPIMSYHSEQILNDMHVANLSALMPRPERRVLYVNYPRDFAGAATVFASKRVRSALDGSKPLDGLTQDYQLNGHWYTLMLAFDEEVTYYFEAFGGALGARSHIAKEMIRCCGSDWAVVSLECAFQTCASACGLWLMEAKGAFVDYLDSACYGSRSFKVFFESWMQAKGVVNLKPLEGSPEYASAKASNYGHITSCREAACQELAEAAAGGQLTWTEGSAILCFCAKNAKVLSATELEARDDADVQ